MRKYFCFILIGSLVYLFPATASAEEKAVLWPERIQATYTPKPDPAELGPEEAAAKELAEKLDTHDLLYTGKVVIDKSDDMLQPVERVAMHNGSKYVVATTPPEIEFGVIPATPHWFPEPLDDHHRAMWANWGQSAYYPVTDKFYCSIGDNGSYNAHLYIVEYDPATKTMTMSPEVNEVLGRSDEVFGEGKIHGNLEFMDGPNLWFCTYWSKYPEPKPEDWDTGYLGGHVMSYNVETQEFVDYGVPMPRASWPSARLDVNRRMIYAAGYWPNFLSYDVDARRPIYAGQLPEELKWSNRVMMIDDATGMLYTSNQDPSDPECNLIKYDYTKNRFELLDAPMPADEIGEDHTIAVMRGCTPKRGADGLLHGITSNGQLFSFDPDAVKVSDLGYGWPGEERYTTSIERSPGGRYLYYVPGAHGHGCRDGSPIMQYDLQTGKRKVLAFVARYYWEKYGYVPSGTFAIKLDDAGERLFIIWNGGYFDEEAAFGEARTSLFKHNAIMLIHIPESERGE
ncbi:MAG: hypothetical protein AMXMBFR82_23880 [Candidatus Hydrogenedentota bacterium]